MAQAMGSRTGRKEKNFAKRMSDHIAVALIIYTMLLIFAVTPAMAAITKSILPYFTLVILVAGVIPFFRRIDKRWKKLIGSELSEGSMGTRFASDVFKLWSVTLGIPLALWLILGIF